MEKFIVVTWPEIQDFMDKPGFKENSHLINDEFGLDKYGSSAYMVSQRWYDDTIAQIMWEDSEADYWIEEGKNFAEYNPD